MKRCFLPYLLIFFSICAVAKSQSRAPLTALDHVSLYAQDPAKSDAFYAGTLHARKVADPANPGATRYYFNSLQYVEILPLPATAGDSRLAAVGFATSNTAKLQAFLAAHNYPAPPSKKAQNFAVNDPEGNRIEFSQPVSFQPFTCFSDVTCHMIHAGFAVHDRAAEDHFYLDTLGFRPYWQGAMTPGKVDWISQQVPDGTEWLEYMMTGPDSDHPSATLSRADLGGMDHISLAVDNMEAAVTLLLKEGRLPGRYNGPQMGRDGKWQTNLYDPDGTRVELMEATPSIEPCCSPYKAPHPSSRPVLRGIASTSKP